MDSSKRAAILMHWRPVRLDWAPRIHGERKCCRRGCTAFLTTNLTTKPGDAWHTLGLRAEIGSTVELAGACWSKPCKVNPFSGRQGVRGSNPPMLHQRLNWELALDSRECQDFCP